MTSLVAQSITFHEPRIYALLNIISNHTISHQQHHTKSTLIMSSSSTKEPAPPTLEEMIITLEDHTWKAMEKQGADLLPFLSDDCIMLFPAGIKVSMTSDPDLETTLTSPAYVPWTGHKMSDIEVTMIGGEGAIISYKVEASRPALDGSDEDDVFKALISSTWRRDERTGRLLLCFHQQSPF